MEYFRQGYTFGQQVINIMQRLDSIADRLTIVKDKNISLKHHLDYVNSLKGKLFDLDVDMQFFANCLELSALSTAETEITFKSKEDKLHYLNYESIILDLHCTKLLNKLHKN